MPLAALPLPEDSAARRRADQAAWLGLWLFAAVATLSIAAQNVFWIALAGWLGRLVLERRAPRLPRLGWLWLAFLLWTLWCSARSENPGASLFTWRKWLLALAAWCASDAVRDRRQLSGLLGTLLLAAAAVNLGASLWFGAQPLAAWLGGKPWAEVSYHWVYDTEWRARAGSGGYMVLSALDATLLAFYAGLAARDAQWRRPRVWACLAALALGLLLTMTRGAWIAAGLSLFALLLLERPRWALAAALVLAALAWSGRDTVFGRRLATVADRSNDSNSERLIMWRAGLVIVRQNPVFGVGDAVHGWERPLPGGGVQAVEGWFRRSLSAGDRAWYAEKGVPGQDNGHLHDTPLQLAVMYGLPGLALAALFFGGLLAWAWARSRDAALGPLGQGGGLGLAAGLLAFFLHGLTEYNLGTFQSSFTLWFLIGLAASAVRLGRKGSR